MPLTYDPTHFNILFINFYSKYVDLAALFRMNWETLSRNLNKAKLILWDDWCYCVAVTEIPSKNDFKQSWSSYCNKSDNLNEDPITDYYMAVLNPYYFCLPKW